MITDTDALNMAELDKLIAKHAHAVAYAGRRRALRRAIALALPDRMLHEVRRQIRNYAYAWQLLRQELRS